MMIGDGLNDAGALKQSDVGVAVCEDASAFSPASDAILDARLLCRIFDILHYSKMAMKIIAVSFAISVAYNVVGIAYAARGSLSPLVSAVLMPLSSVSVVAFACGITHWVGRRVGLGPGSSRGQE